LIFVKENYIEGRRVLRLRGGMIDDLKFEVEVPNIDLIVMDNIKFGDDFFMDDLLRIRFVELRPEDRNCYFYSK
jgi:hypothetical protein